MSKPISSHSYLGCISPDCAVVYCVDRRWFEAEIARLKQELNLREELSSPKIHSRIMNVQRHEELEAEIARLKADLRAQPYHVKCPACETEYANDAGCDLEAENVRLEARLRYFENTFCSTTELIQVRDSDSPQRRILTDKVSDIVDQRDRMREALRLYASEDEGIHNPGPARAALEQSPVQTVLEEKS